MPIFAIRNIYSYRVNSRDKEKTVQETNEMKQQKTKEKNKNSRLNGVFANWVFRFMVSIYLRRSVMQIGEHDCWLICSKRPLVDVGIALRGVSVLIRVFSSIARRVEIRIDNFPSRFDMLPFGFDMLNYGISLCEK